jgi:hypothetical protein
MRNPDSGNLFASQSKIMGGNIIKLDAKIIGMTPP